MENGYSLADIAAATNGEGFGNNWIMVLLFAMIFGWNGNGWNRGGDYGQFATAASQQEILFGQSFQGLDNKIDRLGGGIADSTYALNNAITGEGRAIQNQLAECCCTTQRNTDSVRYDMATMAAGINANIDSKFAALEKSSLEQRIAEQAAQIQQLQMQAQMCGVVRYPMANVYTSGAGPFCNHGGCGCGNVF